MRYSFILAGLSAGAVMAAIQPVQQISDGQIQVPVTSAAAPVSPASPSAPAPVAETVYSTQKVVITSCGPEVVSCPARTYTSVVPASSTPTPAAVTSATTPEVSILAEKEM